MKQEQGPGVPEAIPRTVHGLGTRLGPTTLDRLWIFPPLVRGRREWGLVAASRFASEAGDERRHLFSAPYAAERTGKGLTLDWQVVEQGQALPDRLPRVMDGVARRAGDDLGNAREVEIGGDPERFQALLEELGTELLEPPPAEPLAAEPPAAEPPPGGPTEAAGSREVAETSGPASPAEPEPQPAAEP